MSSDYRPILGSRFLSLSHACRYFLAASRTSDGRHIPVTAHELVAELHKEGFLVTRRDVDAQLRELAESGEAVEIDEQAGYRWAGAAA